MPDKFIIKGGKPLRGDISVGGAKNAAVAILPATLLASDIFVLENLPNIDDVIILLNILNRLGAKVERQSNGSTYIDTRNVRTNDVRISFAKRLRASYYFVGSLLKRFGSAKVFLPGGCDIGSRPIDLHIKGMRALGAKVGQEYGVFFAQADKLTGSDIYMDQVSVGATINIMLTAVMAEGVTTIINAAKEPHVVDTANFLNKMGARIRGVGTDIIKIYGVSQLHGCTYSIIPDQIEAGTLMIAAAATKGDVTVKNIIPLHMDALTAKMIEMGVGLEVFDDAVRVYDKGPLNAVSIKTFPYPGFPTDLQQPATVLLSTANGTSVIMENIFDSRFKHINEIRRMGAKVTIDDRMAVVQGVKKLTGALVKASDLRAGAALIIAGLMAEGTTEIQNIRYIDRGYDHIEKKLIALGADIKRVPMEEDNSEILDLNYFTTPITE